MAQKIPAIAVIGVACRFPGGINNSEKLWDVLVNGKSTWSEVPGDRYDWKSFHHPVRGPTSSHTHRGGHFLDQNIAAFDANFFGISSLEAEAIDPQARIQLEIAYEALESAGISDVKRSDTGVYIATFTHDYENLMYADPLNLPKYGMTGVGQAIISNRISYLLDLRGPSMTLDTGCSGSLVALHQACLSLRSGESSMSLVGGTNLILSPDTMIPMDQLHLLNSDGKCYSFDDRGSGYGRGEGSAMIVLKRLDDALNAGDDIRAIIRNTAIGQDGKTSGITHPNGDAQQALIRSAYSRIGIDPLEISYVEAHGTGTIAGDTTEIEALSRAFCDRRGAGNPLFVGSIKANLGHLESVSGLAGLLKVILMLEKEVIPGTPNIENFKKGLNMDHRQIKIPRTSREWVSNMPRRAGLNSFGYGGTNAHAIIESANPIVERLRKISISSNEDEITPAFHGDYCMRDSESMVSSYRLFSMSAKSEKSLRESMSNLRSWLSGQSNDTEYMFDLAYTLTRRTLMQWRCTFVAANLADLSNLLDPTAWKLCRVASKAPVIFIFTGQGAQWFGMARELLATVKVFQQSLKESDEIIKSLGASWSLIEELSRPEASSPVTESEIRQPATTAVQIGLVKLFRHVGVKPKAVLGHSSGEIAAAYAVGALSHYWAIKLSYHRGFLARRSKQVLQMNGAMLATSLGEDDILRYLKRVKTGRAVVACCNSPFSTTISGDESAVIEFEDMMQQFGISSRRLKVDTAYHSHHMSAVSEEYLLSIQDLQHTIPDPMITFYSSVTATQKAGDFSPAYWVSNLTSKVAFYGTLEALCKDLQEESKQCATASMCTAMEMGPSCTLEGPVKQIFTSMKLEITQFKYISALKSHENSIKTALRAVAALHMRGHDVDLNKANKLDHIPTRASLLTTLPPYPWDHSISYWKESWVSKAHRLRRHPYHDLLGVRIPTSLDDEPRWRHLLCVETLPWLRDHAVDGRLVFPASGHIVMAIEAIRQIMLGREVDRKVRKFLLRDIIFSTFLEIPDSAESVEVQLSLRSSADEDIEGSNCWQEFRVSSLPASGLPIQHCHGSIKVEFESTSGYFVNSGQREEAYFADFQERKFKRLRDSLTTKLQPKEIYNHLRANGNHWGPSFAAIKTVKVGQFEAVGEVMIPDIQKYMPGSYLQPHVIHPATLDALMHTSLVLFGRACSRGVMFPVRIGELTISADIPKTPGRKLSFMTNITPNTMSTTVLEISVLQDCSSSDSKLCVEIKNGELRGAPITQITTPGLDIEFNLYYQLEWGIDTDFCQPDLEVVKLGAEYTMPPVSRLEALNRATQAFIQKGLEEIQESTVKSNHLEYLNWMRQMNDTALARNATQAEIHNLQNLGVEGETLFRVGTNLTSILTGKLDALHLLFQDGLLQRLYSEDSSILACYSQLASYVKALVFKTPRMKVLEIGAGTGGATLPLLQSLSKNWESFMQRYDFTDVSNGFFEDARSKLRFCRDIVHFTTLDIGKSPAQQSFEEHSYDLIIACNSLHVTSSVDEAIAHAGQLLKPGGKLVLIEITKLHPFINMIFGLLPGWYMDREDGRTESPILSIPQWDEHLRRAGFSGIGFFANDYDGPAQTMSLMATIFSAAEESPELGNMPSVCILCRAKTVKSRSVANLYRGHGLKVAIETLPLKKYRSDGLYVLVEDAESLFPLASDPNVLKTLFDDFLACNQVFWINSMAHEDSSGFAVFANELVAGLFRAARAANENLRLATLGIDGGSSDEENVGRAMLKIFERHFLSSSTAPLETDYIYRNGKILIPRLMPNRELNKHLDMACSSRPRLELFHQDVRDFKLSFQPTQDGVDRIQFIDDPSAANMGNTLKCSEIKVRPEAWACMPETLVTASSQLKGYSICPSAFSGIVVAVSPELSEKYQPGTHVYGWSDAGLSSCLRVTSNKVEHLPDSVSFAQGASLLIPYTTSLFALFSIGQLKRGQSVLIHVSGEEGRVAVEIAVRLGADVFATVRTPDEANCLRDSIQIPENHIFWESDTHFILGIQRLTESRGVDVVLNTSSRTRPRDTVACLKYGGIFVQIGGLSDSAKTYLGRQVLEQKLTFKPVDVTALFKDQPDKAEIMLKEITTLIRKERITIAESVALNPISDLESVLKVASSPDAPVQIVFDVGDSSVVKVLPKRPPPVQLLDEGLYVVLGNFDELSLDVCRFLSSRGARSIVNLNWTGSSRSSLPILEEDFNNVGCRTAEILLDCSEANIEDALLDIFGSKPSVNGVVTVLQKSEYSTISEAFLRRLARFSTIIEYLLSCKTSFHVILSSAGSFFVEADKIEHAAAFAFHHISSRNNPGTRTSLIETRTANNSEIENGKLSTIPICPRSPATTSELYSILDFHTDGDSSASVDDSGYLNIGICLEDLESYNESRILDNPLFCHLPRANHHQKIEPENSKPAQISKNLREAENFEGARIIVTAALRTKIASLVAIDYDMIDDNTAMQDFGLDSLVRFTFRNWIFQNFRANIETGEILKSPGIDALTSIILERTSIAYGKEVSNAITSSQVKQSSSHEIESTIGAKVIPKQPLPVLKNALADYLGVARSFCSSDEFERTSRIVEDFGALGGTGQRLHIRLEQKAHDPNIQNWLSDIYLSKRFLQQRSSLVACQSYFGTHPLGERSHTQAERAAIVSLAALKFKHDFESGKLATLQIYGQPVDTSAFRYLFNVCREPHLQEDIIREHPREDYIVVLRYGSAFKINLKRNGTLVSWEALKATFEQILLDTSKPMSWVSMLTADNRDDWAKLRKKLKETNEINGDSLEAILGAAFIVSLDDASPTTAVDRFHQFLFADGSNRWYDKSLQFIVCSNGVSASLCEHSLLDGITIGPLHEYINRSIHESYPSRTTEKTLEIEHLPLFSNGTIDNHILELRQNFKPTTSKYSFSHLKLSSLNSSFLQKHKVPVQSGLQLAIQLAYRRFFGYSPPALETISLAHFKEGRVEVNHILQPEVLQFLDAWETGPTNSLRSLFYEAAKSHAKSLTRASNGHGFGRYLLAMEWMLDENEPTPALFSDPVYTRLKPRKALTSCFATGWEEGGFVYPFPESILVYFEFDDHLTSFSIFGNDADADKFRGLLEVAAEELHGLLDMVD